MTGALPLSAPSTPTRISLKRRRIDATSRNSSLDAAAQIDSSDVSARWKRRRSAGDNTRTSTSIFTSRQRPFERRPDYGKDASLVLIGTKGSGLSSFAVIAATALHFRLIDTATWLAKHYGLHRSDYVKEHGLDAYRKVSSQALEKILQQHGARCVLVCGPEALELHSEVFIRAFSLTHPVIMINRDLTLIRKYLGLQDTDTVLQILGQSQRLCRQISNLEFFNLPENEAPVPLSADLSQKLRGRRQPSNSLALLQNVKQDFLQFLASIGMCPKPESSLLHPSDPLDREYSTSLKLRLEHVALGGSDLVDLDCGADTIELIVPCQTTTHTTYDHDRISRSFQVVRRMSNAPIVYHVECDDSQPSTNAAYAALLSYGLRLQPDFITVDLDCTDHQIHDLIGSVNQTKVIGHKQWSKQDSPAWLSPGLQKAFDRAVALGCDAVRLIQEARSAADDGECVLFQAAVAPQSKTPLIAYTTGIQSRSSMVLNRSLTPICHSIFSSTKSLLTLEQVMKAKFSSFIYQPLHFFIFGASVDYSLSPIMHNAAFKHLAMDHDYSIKQSSNLQDLMPLIDENFGGASISLPFKSEVTSMIDSASEAAKAIQAVNTIIPVRAQSDADDQDFPMLSRSCRNRAGPVTGLHGENTDWTALYTCVARYLSPANTIRSSSSALIVGAGGMARAAMYALIRMGVKNVVIWNRTHSKAIQVAEHFTALANGSHPRPPHEALLSAATETEDFRVDVVESLDAPWPSGLAQPTIVICTIPAHQIENTPPPEFVIPDQWFGSRTGGVIIEVSAFPEYRIGTWLSPVGSFHINRPGRRCCSKHMTMSTKDGSASSHSKFLSNKVVHNSSFSLVTRHRRRRSKTVSSRSI